MNLFFTQGKDRREKGKKTGQKKSQEVSILYVHEQFAFNSDVLDPLSQVTLCVMF